MHEETLGKAIAPLFPLLPKFRGFYLSGGTGMALQLGHRISADFDLFSNEEIKKSLLTEVQKIFVGKTIIPLVNDKEELTVFVNGGKITFLHYPFPVIRKFVYCKNVPVLSYKEIAATKAYTIGRRGSLKDYIDLYFAMKTGKMKLKEIMDLAQKKYSTAWNDRLFLEQLIYLNDIEDSPVKFLKKPITKRQLATAFAEKIKSLGL